MAAGWCPLQRMHTAVLGIDLLREVRPCVWQSLQNELCAVFFLELLVKIKTLAAAVWRLWGSRQDASWGPKRRILVKTVKWVGTRKDSDTIQIADHWGQVLG